MKAMISNWRDRETITVPEYAKVIGVCLTTAYNSINAGEVETIRVRRKILVCVPPLRRKIDGGERD